MSDDGGWHVSIPRVKGCHTWGRTLEAGRAHIREALSACIDVFPDAEKGLSLRDAGTLLGLSQEGVRQLLEKSA